MQNKNVTGDEIDKSITSDDILGKEVIDLEGKYIGVVEKILIDPKSLNILGVEVDKGFLKKSLKIGKDYIDYVTEHALFLKIKVLYEIKNMRVFDVKGEDVGCVSNIELHGKQNRIKNISINRGFLKKDSKLPA